LLSLLRYSKIAFERQSQNRIAVNHLFYVDDNGGVTTHQTFSIDSIEGAKSLRLSQACHDTPTRPAVTRKSVVISRKPLSFALAGVVAF